MINSQMVFNIKWFIHYIWGESLTAISNTQIKEIIKQEMITKILYTR